MSLDLDAQPPESRPPSQWKHDGGRKAAEQVVPKVHLTMYTKVSAVSLSRVYTQMLRLGRNVGAHEGDSARRMSQRGHWVIYLYLNVCYPRDPALNLLWTFNPKLSRRA